MLTFKMKVVLQALLLCSLTFGLVGASAQRSSGSAAQNAESFSSFATVQPNVADSTACPRYAAGDTVTSPPELKSQNNKLEVTFNFKTVTTGGITRYCFVTDAGLESPTLRVNPGDTLIIHLKNTLGSGTATTVTDCNATMADMSSTSTNLHFHGVNASPGCHQDEVVHTLVPAQGTFDYSVVIPSNEPPGLYWYHPHPHGFSEGQVLGGATGALIVEGLQTVNTSLASLPEKVYVLRDQKVTSTATSTTVTKPQNDLSINYVPITYPTETPAVISTAPAQKQLWRVLNSTADTALDLEVTVGGTAQPLQIVDVDGVPVTNSTGTVTHYALPSGARVEFVVTTPSLGQTVQLQSLTWNTGTDGDPDPGRIIATITPSTTAAAATTPSVQAQNVQPVALPKTMRFAALATAAATTSRKLYFSTNSNFTEFYITEEGKTPAVFDMDGPPNITVQAGTVEEWTIENRSKMDHNFHIHQIHFSVDAVNGDTSKADSTLRDTINIPHWDGTSSTYPSVTLKMDFRDLNIIGIFPYHCHILSHEDLGMMGTIQVQAQTTTSVSSTATTIVTGSSATLTAKVTSSASTVPTGTVTFSSGSTSLGTATLDSSGTATLTTASLPIGTDSITASYSGDNAFSTSTSSAVSVTVNPLTTTTTMLTATPSTASFGSSVLLTATVTPGSGTTVPTGTVTFYDGATSLGSAALNGSGVATFTAASLPIGSNSITAVYNAVSPFSGSTSAALTVTINKIATTTTLTASATTATAGASLTFTATVGGGSGTTVPTGSVIFSNGTTALGTVVINSSGVATYTTTALPVGSNSIAAAYSGDSSFSSSTSAALAITINAPPPADFTLGVNPASLSLSTGKSGTSTITLTPQNGFNTAVTFSCTGLPLQSQCSFSPQTVTPDGTNAASTTLTITTTASTASLQEPAPFSHQPLLAFLFPGIGITLGLTLRSRKRLSNGFRHFGTLLLVLSFAGLLNACGGSKVNTGTGNTGTPTGTSTITITATTSGSTPTTHTSTLSLTVTQYDRAKEKGERTAKPLSRLFSWMV
jgi:FtsP/CotA-like multicopper oxidase with cupredoxin domain